MQTSNYIDKLPLIYVRELTTEYIHVVGSEDYDQLYIDEEGRIQYCDTSNNTGTKNGCYEFVKDESGHNPKSKPVRSGYSVDSDNRLSIYDYSNEPISKIYEIEMQDPLDYGIQNLSKKLAYAKRRVWCSNC